MALSAEAVALWVRAGAYSCQHLTDGVILSRVTALLDPSEARFEHSQELVRAGLWKPIRDGYKFHDWEDYQETSSDVKRRREQWKERQRKARESRDMSRVTHGVTHSEVTRESPSPVPSRPDHRESSTKTLPRVTAQDFDTWWSHWPKKVGKKKAREHFTPAVRELGLDPLIAKTDEWIEKFDATGSDRRFIPDPERWLKYKRWEDDFNVGSPDQSDIPSFWRDQ